MTTAYNVYIGRKLIDTVFQSGSSTAAEVKRSLVNHDGYDPRIKVTKQKARSTMASRSRASHSYGRKNPTKAQKLAKARKASVERRAAAALRKYLKIQNPAMKAIGAAVQKLKRGVLKITPIKAKRGRK